MFKGVAAFLVLTGLVSVSSRADGLPLSLEPGRVLYQIYVETFRDGSALEGRPVAGTGNFDGLRRSLGYLRETGVTGVLLMPIFQAGGMGYIPDDFFVVRESYTRGGSPEERMRNFELFTRAAHEAGIKVFLDAPVNHISDGSEWFRDSAARVPGFEDYFLWENSPRVGWRRPWQSNSVPSDVWYLHPERGQYFYGLFGRGMPDVNHASPRVVAEFDRFFETYASLGADGFRIDAARHLVEDPRDNANSSYPGNIARLKSYLGKLRRRHPRQSFLLEIWSGHHDIDPYIPDGGDVAFDFPFMETLRDSLKGRHPYAVKRTLKHFEATQERIGHGSRILMLGNHDIPRIRTFMEDERSAVELSMALTLSLPEIPMLYYGDELYMPGDYQRDESGGTRLNGVCTPMAWTPGPNAGFTDPSVELGDDWNRKLHEGWRTLNVETESADPGSMLTLVRQLIAARGRLPISNGTRLVVSGAAEDAEPVLQVAMRFEDGSCAVGLYNFSDQPQPARATRVPGVCDGDGGGEVLVSRRAEIANGEVRLLGRGFHWERRAR